MDERGYDNGRQMGKMETWIPVVKGSVFGGASSRRESVDPVMRTQVTKVERKKKKKRWGGRGPQVEADWQYVIVVSRVFFCWSQQHRQWPGRGDRTERCRYLFSTAYANNSGSCPPRLTLLCSSSPSSPPGHPCQRLSFEDRCRLSQGRLCMMTFPCCICGFRERCRKRRCPR